MKKVTAIISCTIVLAAAVSPGRSSAQRAGVALIEEIAGTVLFKQAEGARVVRLQAQSNKGRRLSAGEQVSCGPGGRLVLQIGGSVREFVGPSAWFKIPQGASPESAAIQKALDEYGRVGGRDRGPRSDLLVTSPLDKSIVVPGYFLVRWLPRKHNCFVSLRVEGSAGNPLWTEQNIHGVKGRFASEQARAALGKYRSEVGSGPLRFKFSDSCGDKVDLTFSLMSTEDEASLKQDLSQWDKVPGRLMPYLGRAWTFITYQMFAEAAAEYEAALAVAPASVELLKRTITAHRRTGNSVREMELTRRLPPGTQVP